MKLLVNVEKSKVLLLPLDINIMDMSRMLVNENRIVHDVFLPKNVSIGTGRR